MIKPAPPLYVSGPNKGLPILNERAPAVSFFEFWPLWVFYVPVVFYWVWLAIRYRSFGLPLLANPNILLGGMVGESKADILRQAGRDAQQRILAFFLFRLDNSTPLQVQRDTVLNAMNAHGIIFPCVLKPDQGCRGMGVQVIKDSHALQAYLTAFPANNQCMVQQLSQYQAEAGVFYVRKPGEEGCITSITLKYRATVIGDGEKTLGGLIDADPRASKLACLYKARLKQELHRVPALGEQVPLVFAGSHCRGSVFKDGCKYITPQLTAAVDGFMRDFPEFYYGRLDVKFANLNELMRGQKFEIIEVNGASSEQTHIWDSEGSFSGAIRCLLWQYKTLFEIGSRLRKQGKKPPSLRLLIKTWRAEMAQFTSYPSTD